MAAEAARKVLKRSLCSVANQSFTKPIYGKQYRLVKMVCPIKRHHFTVNRAIHNAVLCLSSKGHSRTKYPVKDLTPKQEQDEFICVAYSTAKRYNLSGLRRFLDCAEQTKYTVAAMPKDARDVLHVCINDKGKSAGEIYFFRHLGSVVFWNVALEETSYDKVEVYRARGSSRAGRSGGFVKAHEKQLIFQKGSNRPRKIKRVRHMVRQFQEGSYDEALIHTENEQLSFAYSKNPTNLVKGKVVLNEASSEESQALEKYAFSNAMALSVKLAIWEVSLDQYVDSIKWVPEALRRGIIMRMSRKEVMKKTGELFSLRYKINLYSDLLMTPDFYWDNENLEPLYEKTCYYLEIARRTKVMNEKLTHCTELADLLREHLSEQHSFRLEWGIIWLIAIEVLFEIVHLVDRFYISSN